MRTSRLLAVVMVTALVLTPSSAVSSPATDPPADRHLSGPDRASRYDARTVFRGLMFGHGPLAEQLPEYFATIPPATPDILRAEDRLMDDLERQSPGTIATLHDAVQAGSHVRTQAAIDDAHAAVRRLLGPNQAGPGDAEITVLIPVAVVVVVIVVKYVYKYNEFAEVEPNSHASRLQRERLVHRVIVTVNR